MFRKRYIRRLLNWYRERQLWEKLSLAFWLVVSFIVIFAALILPLFLQNKFKIEPMLLSISIIATIFYSYVLIFIPVRTNYNFKSPKRSWLGLGLCTLFLILFAVILCHVFINDAFDTTGTGAARRSAVDTWWFMGPLASIVVEGHALVAVIVLSAIDWIIYKSLALDDGNVQGRSTSESRSDQDRIRDDFRRLLIAIDIPTLGALTLIKAIEWKWWPNGGLTPFEAGAVTFQLLTANFSIVLGDIVLQQVRKREVDGRRGTVASS